MRPPRAAVAALLTLTIILAAGVQVAFADVTVFVGSTTTPANRAAKGVAIGAGLLVVAFEFEYSSTAEHPEDAAPSLNTGMGNLVLQTPLAIAGIRPYFTTGGGIYRESLGDRQETQFGVNVGGGVKISLLGPLRARLDYRAFSLKGDPIHSTVHRVYAGLNLAF